MTFDWCADLGLEPVDSLGQMEQEFLNRFYNTFSMIELTNTKQWKNELVLDYINA